MFKKQKKTHVQIHPGIIRDTVVTNQSVRSSGKSRRGGARSDHKNTNGYPAYYDAYIGT